MGPWGRPYPRPFRAALSCLLRTQPCPPARPTHTVRRLRSKMSPWRGTTQSPSPLTKRTPGGEAPDNPHTVRRLRSIRSPSRAYNLCQKRLPTQVPQTTPLRLPCGGCAQRCRPAGCSTCERSALAAACGAARGPGCPPAAPAAWAATRSVVQRDSRGRLGGVGGREWCGLGEGAVDAAGLGETVGQHIYADGRGNPACAPLAHAPIQPL